MFNFRYLLILIFMLWSGLSFSSGAFSDMDCIKGNFGTKVTHRGSFLGLFDNILTVTKKSCVLTVTHEKFKFLKDRWIIDICRGPVHIKFGTSGIDVFKRESKCLQSVKGGGEFCKSLNELNHILEDSGLIFAEGERENIKDSHGQIYCSFLLIDAYLAKGMIFNRHKSYENVLDKTLYDGLTPQILDSTKAMPALTKEPEALIKKESSEGTY